MPNTFRFVPASIDAFKRTARDIQHAYPLKLQQCQEALAQIYGYPDFHALQEHCKQKPEAGPFPCDMEGIAPYSARTQAASKFYALSGRCPPTGRLTIDDLAIFDDPQSRKAVMDFEAAVDAEINGTSSAEPSTPTSEYVWFEESDQLIDPMFSKRTYHEGVFRLTSRGAMIDKALAWITEQIRDSAPGEVRNSAIDSLQRLMVAHPNNPFPAASWIWLAFDDLDFAIPSNLAQEIWPQAKACRKLFESVMPRQFHGKIEPKLIGNNAANLHYFAVLFWGASCAETLGHTREALAWARRSLKFHRNDSFGARFIVDRIVGT